MKKNRFIPYGYTIRNGYTVIDRDEALIIRGIYKEYIGGASLKDIAEYLTKKKIPYTEKSDKWDKARIARIIDNSTYLGDDEYDSIIDDLTYKNAVAVKKARQRNKVGQENQSIELLKNKVKCASCGFPMVRRVCTKQNPKERWKCTNPECGCKCKISDGDLLNKITLIINRIIRNADLMIPKPKVKSDDSPVVLKLQNEYEEELKNPNPSQTYVISKLSEIANQLYKESSADQIINAHASRKKAALMKEQEFFNGEYFSDLISYITLTSDGNVTLHTKADTNISEGDDSDDSNENT